MNKKTILVILALLVLSVPVQAGIVATISMTGLSFVSPELASAVNVALCVISPTGIVTCAAQYVEGKIVGQVVGEAYEAIAEVSPEAAQVISTYNQINGYMELGTQIVEDLSVDETGNVVNGKLDIGEEEIGIGNQLGKDFNEEDIKISNAEVSFSEESENKKSIRIDFKEGGTFSQVAYDKDTGEPIEINTKISEGFLKFDYETGKPTSIFFSTNEETSFLFGTDEVFIPANSEVEDDFENNLIISPRLDLREYESYSIFSLGGFSKRFTGEHEEIIIPLIDDIKKPRRINMEGDSSIIKYEFKHEGRFSEHDEPRNFGRTESGMLFSGKLSYQDGKYFLDKSNNIRIKSDDYFYSRTNINWGSHLPTNNLRSIKVLNSGEGRINLDSNIITYNAHNQIEDFNLNIEEEADISFSFRENPNIDLYSNQLKGETRLVSIKNSRIKMFSRSDLDLIPMLEIEANDEDSSFDLINGASTFYKIKNEFRYTPFNRLEEYQDKKIDSAVRYSLLIKDNKGNSIFGSEDKQKKIIFNDFGEFITIPVEDKGVESGMFLEDPFDKTRMRVFPFQDEVFSEARKGPTTEVLGKYLSIKYNIGNIYGLEKEHVFPLYESLGIMNDEMLKSVNDIHFITNMGAFGYENPETVGGFADHYTKDIHIKNFNVNTIIHEIGHTLTFRIEEKYEKEALDEWQTDFYELDRKAKNGEITRSEFKIEKKKIDDKFEQFKGGPLRKKWENIVGDIYSKDLGEKTVGVTKNWEGNSARWATGYPLGPKHGCLEEYGCNNFWEDTATFIEEAYKFKYRDSCGKWCLKKVREDPIYFEKLKLLREFDAISEELYLEIKEAMEYTNE